MYYNTFKNRIVNTIGTGINCVSNSDFDDINEWHAQTQIQRDIRTEAHSTELNKKKSTKKNQ